jgi:hypothetical protein
VQPASYTVSENTLASAPHGPAYMGALALIGIVLASFFRMTAFAATVETSPEAQWVKDGRPGANFELLIPGLSRLPFDYVIYRRAIDGARMESLAWGVGFSEPHVQVEIYRATTKSTPFIEAERESEVRLNDYRITDRVEPAGHIDSKFGTMSLINSVFSEFGRTFNCLRFERPFDESAVRVTGEYCSLQDEQDVARPMLACMLSTLTILSTGSDSVPNARFAQAEIRRMACGRGAILPVTPELEDKLHSEFRQR